jgi:hypothetical protein
MKKKNVPKLANLPFLQKKSGAFSVLQPQWPPGSQRQALVWAASEAERQGAMAGTGGGRRPLAGVKTHDVFEFPGYNSRPYEWLDRAVRRSVFGLTRR